MTDTERKALALVNDTFRERYYRDWSQVPQGCLSEALCRAIERHEAFRQEVSDAVEGFWNYCRTTNTPFPADLDRFILPKPDPLVEALDEALWEVSNVKLTDRELRAVSLRLNAKRGGKIVWGEG